ncbi:MAG TPA: haloacid dehalogenase-like hydrolase [Acidobacteriaceae bacterium]
MTVVSSSPASPLVLSTEELFSRVESLSPRIAVFDCDGTLWSGDAGSTFMWWSMETGLLAPDVSDWLRGRYAAYKAGDVSELIICGEMVQCYRTLHVDDLRAAAATFFAEHVERNIFPEMKKLVADLLDKGVDIWAVSSTCDWVIEEGVKRFNIAPDRVLAARVEVVAGTATNRLLEVPTDEGKVASLKRVGITAPDAVFGNSVHDAAMLAIARAAFPINPTPALVDRSESEGWAVYYPHSVAPSIAG